MKKTLLALTLLSSLSFATDSNMSWVDQKIKEIKPERTGLSNTSLKRLKNPFLVVVDKNAVKHKTTVNPNSKNAPTKRDMSKAPLTLQMVLNSSALINNKWLKENDVTRGYKLTQIQSGYVVLERKNKKIKLFIAQKSKNLNISTK